jgi:integrating conjugative element protein (TIGR03761 family)
MKTEDAIAQQTDPHLVARSTPPEKPGALHGEVWLTVQTSLAQKLIHGRDGTPEKPTIIGLVGFANRMRVIWQGARNDDPYADWWLIKVHEAIQVAEKYIRDRHTNLSTQLNEITAMQVNIAESQKPYRVPLRFANPYAYRGAQLIADLDKLVCMAMTARHIGMLSTKACEDRVKGCARKIRAIFVIPHSYRLLKIDRDTVRRAIGRSNEARQVMGVVPEDILSGERQAPIVPRKINLPSNMSGHVGLHPRSSDGNHHG